MRKQNALSVSLTSGAAIYGLITVGAVMAAEASASETYGETVGGVALVLLLYWLAHAYAEFASRRMREGEPLTLSGLARTMLHELPIVIGAAVPLLAVLIGWVAGAKLASAISAGLWTAIGSIVTIEIVAGIRAELSFRELVVQGAVGTTLGLLVLGLSLALH